MEDKKQDGSTKEPEHVPEETPKVYTVEKDLGGWRFNRRAFLAAAGTATAAAVVGSVAGCDEGGQGPVQVVDVIVDVTATPAPPTATLATQPEESKPPEESPQPADTQPPTEPPRTEAPPTATSTVAPTGTPTQEPPKAEFVKDVTIPDGTPMKPNQSFTKTWRYRNSGNVPWGQGVKLVFVSETIQGFQSNRMGGPASVNVPNVAPGENVDISVNLVAPATAGRYRGYWRLQLPNGDWLENNHYVEIVVRIDTPTPKPSPTPSCGCDGDCGCDGHCECEGDCGCHKHKDDDGPHYWFPN